MADVLYAQNDKGEKLAYINGEWKPIGQENAVQGLIQKGLQYIAPVVPGPILQALQTAPEAKTAVLQGAALGFGDEGLAAAQALSDYKSGVTQSPMQSYEQRRQEIQNRMQAYRQESPVASTALELAGGLMTGGIGAGRAAGLTGVQRLAALAGTGAAYGGLAGAGYADPGERLKGAATGALMGGALGVAVPMVAQGVRGALRKTSGAGDMLSAKGRAGMYLGKQLEESGMTPQQLQARMARYGEGTMYADIPAFHPAVQTLGTQPVKGAKQLSSILTKRDLTMNKRVIGNIGRALGDEDIYSVVDDIAARQKQLASPLYDKAMTATANIDDVVKYTDDLLGKSTGKIANQIRRVSRMLAPDGKPISSMEVLHGAKMEIDDMISVAQRQGQKNAVRQLMDIKTRLLKKMDNVEIDGEKVYRMARNIFADEAANKDALDFGRKLINQDIGMSAKMIRNMSDSEREMMRLGLASALKEKVLGAPDGANAWKKIMNSTLIREKIRAAFPDRASYMAFKNMMRKEAIYSTTKGVMRGGSNTAQKLANIENAGQLLDVLQSNRGVIDRTVTALVNWAKKKFFLNPETMNEVANMLKSDLSNPEFINLLMKKSATLGKDSKQLISQLIAMAITRETLKSMPGE